MNCNTTHYRANSSSVPGDPTDDQQRLIDETGNAQTQQAPVLAGRQRDVADAIARAGGYRSSAGDSSSADPNWRGRATAAVLAAQETLASMPQHLAAAQEALVPWREAVARAEQTKKEAGAMPDETRQPAAVRASEQAAQDAADAGKRFEQRRQSVSLSAGQTLASSLDPFAPETDGVIGVIDNQLLPALARLEASSNAGDVAAFDRAADEARQAIDAAQRELTLAQDALVARDPLIAAKSFARAAADSLERSPPDLRAAHARQRYSRAALDRAWDRSIHEAAALRMASLPALQSVYGPPVPATSAQPPTAAAAARAPGSEKPSAASAAAAAEALLGRGLAAVREWGRLRPHDVGDDASSAPMGETEPLGYEEALRVYFEALGKDAAGAASPTTSPAAK